MIQDNLDGALQDWEKALVIDLEQTERILGLRETGFGDSALEQLPDSTRDKIQKLAQDLQNRNSPAAHLALAFLAEQNGNFSQAAAESSLAAPPSPRRMLRARNCTEEDVNLALQRGEFSKVPPCAGRFSLHDPPLNFAFEWRPHCWKQDSLKPLSRLLKELPAADSTFGRGGLLARALLRKTGNGGLSPALPGRPQFVSLASTDGRS